MWCVALRQPSYLGESDLLILVDDPGRGKMALLIENKIDAPPQPGQAARYRRRGEAGISTGTWNLYRTCIVAPQKYLTGTLDAAEYDFGISYESIHAWFLQPDQQNGRSAYKSKMLGYAIEQNRRGYKSVPHPQVTRFWLDYWHFAATEFPQLEMKNPGQVPAGSDWPLFKPLSLSKGRRIYHKLLEGFVDMEIRSAGALVEQIAQQNQESLKNEVLVVRTGQSASIRILVQKVDRFGDFLPQIEMVRVGLLAAAKLFSLSSKITVS